MPRRQRLIRAREIQHMMAAAASTANTPNSQCAAVASPRSATLTTTPASAAPNAPQITCTVLMAAAAAGPSAGSRTLPIAHADRCGHAIPIPEPVIEGAATRVMSLRDGAAKMSKSDPSDLSRINLTDDADAIAPADEDDAASGGAGRSSRLAR